MVTRNITKWFKDNKEGVVRNSFLLPILLVVIMSISHVVSWYDLGNPLSWAIYLSIAIEIFALASVSAASIRASRGTIWFLFSLVTAIQVIGNVFYEYKEIDPAGEGFLAWVDLISPIFMDWDFTDHRRLLALVQGGTLPIMSLTSLHFYLQFNEKIDSEKKAILPKKDEPIIEVKNEIKPVKEVEPIDEDAIINDEPSFVEVKPEVLKSSENNETEKNIEELDKAENRKRSSGYGPGISPTEKPRSKNSFGPPNINKDGNV